MLVTDADRVLLGRAPSWPPRRYSALAGFVEPGESLEEAVAREVAEESGVEVGRPRYVASQPWPFPVVAHARLRGAVARRRAARARRTRSRTCAGSRAPRSRRGRRADLDGWGGTPGRGPEATALLLPPRLAIARRLLERWLER